VVTGGSKLYNRLIADDCETSASFLAGVHKTFMHIRAYLVLKKIWDDTKLDDAAFFAMKIPDEVVLKLTTYPGTKKLFPDGQGKLIVKALANILRQYHLRVELCVGSASSASVGTSGKASGHCFAMLEAKHFSGTGPTTNHILEGTSWICQKTCMGVKNTGQFVKIQDKLTEISCIMAEVTKNLDVQQKILFDVKKNKHMDHYKTLAEVRQKTSGAFWKSIYAKGNSLMSYRNGLAYIYGVKVCDIMNDDQNIKKLPVTYDIVNQNLRLHGIAMDEGRIGSLVREIGKAESVPPWTIKQWHTIMDKYLPCIVHGTDTSAVTKKDISKVRFAFTHQMYDDVESNQYKLACEAIRTRLNNNDFASITNAYYKTHADWLLKFEGKMNQEEWDVNLNTEFEKMQKDTPDFAKAMTYISELSDVVNVVKTYVCMQSIVVVCSVHETHVHSAHSRLMSWVSVLAKAFTTRKAFETNYRKIKGVYP
jgi:hypothetical protein